MTLNYAEAIYALDDSSLDVYQSRVWLRVLRRKVCFESQRNMAEGIGISLGKVNQALQWLLENGWIVRDVDKRTQKVGYVAVLPDEQTQQNSLHDVNDVLPDEHDVLPDERHLKAKESKQNNKTRVDETLIALFEGLTAFTAPHETTDMYTDDWLKPVQAIFSQSKDYAEAEERITYAIQHLRKIRYTIISPNSILKTALNWQSGDKPGGKRVANGSSPSTSNGAADDGSVWDLVLAHARRGDSKFDDPAIRAAVVAYGWPKLQGIPTGKENFYKPDFMRIYHEQSAITTA